MPSLTKAMYLILSLFDTSAQQVSFGMPQYVLHALWTYLCPPLCPIYILVKALQYGKKYHEVVGERLIQRKAKLSAVLDSRPCPSAIFPYCMSSGGALTGLLY